LSAEEIASVQPRGHNKFNGRKEGRKEIYIQDQPIGLQRRIYLEMVCLAYVHCIIHNADPDMKGANSLKSVNWAPTCHVDQVYYKPLVSRHLICSY
jgi:hypothetical protein